MAATDSTRGGLRAVLVATAVAGVVGYAIQLMAPALLASEAAYVSFSVFWSTLYLGGAAISGVQQEVARAAHPAVGGDGGRMLRSFTVGATAVVLAAAVVVSLVFGREIIPGSLPAVTLALVVGFVGYLMTAVLTGIFYGLHLWRAVAFIVILDALLRAGLVITGLVAGGSVALLALLVSIPFGLAALGSWIAFRGRVAGAFALDVRPRRLVGQASSMVVAASASGVMISGLPMLVGLTSATVPTATTGALLLAITVTRAPIVIPVIALQSFLISAVFRGGRVRGARVIRLAAAAVVVGVGLAVLGWFAGPPVVSGISGGRFALPAAAAAAIVFSACLVAILCVTGPALVSVRRHATNVVGWSVAALTTVLVLLAPLGELRVPLALILPPALGLAIHIGVLLRDRGAAPALLDVPAEPPLGP